MTLLNKILQGSVLLALIVLVALLWRPAPQMALALGLLGGIMVVLMLVVQRRRLGDMRIAAATPSTPEEDERRARFVVTQLLGELTRTQVTYLRQDFRDADEGRSWLKRVLPRSYGATIDQIHHDLEAARQGEAPENLKLPLRILELYETRMKATEEALLAAAKEHPDHDLAHPVIFVVTEHIEIDRDDSEPELSLVAGWDPATTTLLPATDTLTIFNKEGNTKRAIGQVPFAVALEHFDAQLHPVKGNRGAPKIFAFDPPKTPSDIPSMPIPLGFIIGASELM